MERLETLQRESQERHSRKINPTCYLHVDKYIERLEAFVEKKFTKKEITPPKNPFPTIEIFKFYEAAKRLEPKTTLPKYFKETPVTPDEKKVFIRPPAEYSNKSPYGIASDLLLMK